MSHDAGKINLRIIIIINTSENRITNGLYKINHVP